MNKSKALTWTKELFQHHIIQMALALAFCTLLISIVSEKVLHIEVSNIAKFIPALFVTGFEFCNSQERLKKYAKIIYWIIAMIASAILVLVYYAYWKTA